MPSAQVTQAPPLQTCPEEQPLLFPSGTLPLSMHWGEPMAQEIVPCLQGVADVQEAPSVQGTQAPLLQTMLAPHDLPLGTLVLESTQSGTPPLQARAPA